MSHIVFNSPHPQLTNCLVTYPNVVIDEVIETAKNRAHMLREVCKRIYCPFISELSSDIHCIITDASLKFGLQPGVRNLLMVPSRALGEVSRRQIRGRSVQ